MPDSQILRFTIGSFSCGLTHWSADLQLSLSIFLSMIDEIASNWIKITLLPFDVIVLVENKNLNKFGKPTNSYVYDTRL